MKNSDELLAGFDTILEQLRADITSGVFRPVVEADIPAYIYHLLVAGGHATLAEVHVNTRVRGLPVNTRVRGLPGGFVDLVVGDVDSITDPNSKNIVRQVRPRLSVEVKFLAVDNKGWSNQVGSIENDIRKLARVQKRNRGSKSVVLCVDEKSYMDEQKHAKLRTKVERKGIAFRYVGMGSSPHARKGKKQLDHILEVAKRVILDGQERKAAMHEVAKRSGDIEYSSVSAACTSCLGLNTEEFDKLLRDPEELIRFLLDEWPGESERIERALKR